MKYLFFIASLLFIYSCAATKKQTSLNGIWTPVKEEIGGQSLPPAAFKDQQLIIEDSVYTFQAESLDKGIAKYKNGQMDIYGKEGVNAGKHFRAIYKLENDLLTICYNLAGDTYPAGFETGKTATLFLAVFTKNY